MADVQIIDGGSVVGFRPTTEAAKEWFDENVHSEGWQWMGPTLYVDHRFADAIATGLVAEGFEVVS